MHAGEMEKMVSCLLLIIVVDVSPVYEATLEMSTH